MRIIAMGLALLAATAATAAAEDEETDAIGVGASTTIGGSSGVHVRKLVIPKVEVMATLGVAIDAVTVDVGGMDQESTLTRLSGGLYGAYRLRAAGPLALSALGGLDVAYVKDAAGDSSDQATDLVIGAGLRAEVFPTARVSAFLQAGLTIDILAEEEVADGMVVVGGSGLGVGVGSDLVGAAGFTVWFR